MNDIQVNVYNYKTMMLRPPEKFEFIRLDSNNDCNVHCVYCHNHRSPDLISLQNLQRFFNQNVKKVNHFQVGCIMEPTLDKRLVDILLMIANSPARPMNEFILQTNGILLHLHDLQKIQASRLNVLSVSVDSAVSESHKLLRGGTSLAKVLRNVTVFRKTCPSIQVVFITTVTKANLGECEDLVLLGLESGVSKFVFREMFYHPNSEIVDHLKMTQLLLGECDFSELEKRLRSRFSSQTSFEFASQRTLVDFDKQMKIRSARS